MEKVISIRRNEENLEKIFIDLAAEGTRVVKVRFPIEWMDSVDDEKLHAKQVLLAAGKSGVEISGILSPDQTIFDKTNPREDQPKTKGRFRTMVWIIILMVISGVVGGGIYFSKLALEEKSTEKEESIPTSNVITISSTPMATLTPELIKNDLVVRVLNGSGEPGAAKKAADMLIAAGYTVLEVKNASSYDYDVSRLRLKSQTEIYRQSLISDLSDEYSIASGSALVDEEDAGAEFIAGRK